MKFALIAGSIAVLTACSAGPSPQTVDASPEPERRGTVTYVTPSSEPGSVYQTPAPNTGDGPFAGCGSGNVRPYLVRYTLGGAGTFDVQVMSDCEHEAGRAALRGLPEGAVVVEVVPL